MPSQTNLNLSTQPTGPVECLGQTFPSEAARREHYLGLLAEKLKDPEFRKIEGFPIGEDEDILALSDPPYYTACPNPWMDDFIQHYGRPYDPKEKYHREPLAADVSEGKSHPIYNAHSYHTKVPHRAIMRYILHYTEPGDVVFDGFCGTGMTGVAAQLCGDRKEVQELGCRVDEQGSVFDESGRTISKLGGRRSALNDLSPAATFIACNYNAAIDMTIFEREANRILNEVENELGWMYVTNDQAGRSGTIDTVVWSELFSCPHCAGEIVFLKEALNAATNKVRPEFPCPHCATSLTKDSLVRVFETMVDNGLGTPRRTVKYQPCIVEYTVGKKHFKKEPDANDLALISKIASLPLPESVPLDRFPIEDMYHGSRIEPKGFTCVHHFYLPRIAHTIGAFWRKASMVGDRRLELLLKFWIDSQMVNLSIQNRYRPEVSFPYNPLGGVYYIPGMVSEASPFTAYRNKLRRLAAAFSTIRPRTELCVVGTGTASSVTLPPESIDYIFTDPPFGENIFYADMNFLVESWHRVVTRSEPEAIIDSTKKKQLEEYQSLIFACFKEYYRILKPGRWMTVEFSNSQAAVWNAIQSTLQEAGFVVANVAALDKQQRSFRSVTSPTAVKQDLVISAYKPNGGLEERFRKSGHTVEGVWDFMRTHLRNLPILKPKGGELEFIAERDPRILYDRMVAFYVGHGVPVPLSSAEFQRALADKFPEREGMFFLSEQVAEFDKKRAQMEGVGQMSIFVEDEKSAIDWLRGFLKNRPSTYQDIQPEFMQQLSASWKKFEARPELRLLLEQNFLQYKGHEEVPSQIHSYLSTQNKDLRSLPKDDNRLQARAKDRWYVPDPAKAVDVEAIRNKRLLEEFWALCDDAGIARPKPGDANQPALPIALPAAVKKGSRKKAKEVRTEAVRTGFKECFARKDYGTILAIAQHLPDNVIEEDEQLQMIHDMAEMRAQG